MKIKRIMCLIIITLLVFIGATTVNAASATISATSTNVEEGEDVTVNVSFTAAAWNLTVSGDKITGDTYASQTSDLSETTTNKSFSVDTTTAGTYTIKLTGDITDENGNTTEIKDKSVTITVTKAEQEQPKEEEKTEEQPKEEEKKEEKKEEAKPEAEQKSNNAMLYNFGIKPHDFTGFRGGKTDYKTEVPYETEKIEIYGYKWQENGKTLEGQEIEGLGEKTLKVGDNKFEVKVTAEDGTTTKTYTLNVVRKQQGEEVKKEEEKKEETTEEPIKEGFGLSDLKIEGVEFSPKFKTDVFEYKVNLTDDLEKLDIKATAVQEDSTVEIMGNEKFHEGENIVTITVKTKKDGKETKAAYQIVVNKIAKGDVANTIVTKVSNNEDGFSKIILGIVVGGILLIVILIVVILRIRKTSGLYEEDEEDEEAKEFEEENRRIFESINKKIDVDEMYDQKIDEDIKEKFEETAEQSYNNKFEYNNYEENTNNEEPVEEYSENSESYSNYEEKNETETEYEAKKENTEELSREELFKRKLDEFLANKNNEEESNDKTMFKKKPKGKRFK